MPGSVYHEVMRRIHGTDIYAGFVPMFPEDRQGWNSEHPIFDEIVHATRPDIIIDVGAWKGASTIFLAELQKKHAIPGIVIAVDTFLGSVEHWDRASGFAGLIPHRHGMPLLYEQFLSNVVRSGSRDRIVQLPLTSTAAALLLQRLAIRGGLIHIDASHEYDDVIRDVRSYWNILAPNGVLVGDDYSRDWPGVIKAADQFAAEIGIPLVTRSPKWIVKKPA